MSITKASDLAAGQIAMVGMARYVYQHDSICPKLFTRIELAPGEKSHYIPEMNLGM